MINLILLFVVPHLGTLADLLGVTLSTFRQIHRSAGVMAVMLTIFHVLVMIASQPSFTLDLAQNKFAVIVSSLLATFLR
jgi:predicted ferric reductase